MGFANSFIKGGKSGTNSANRPPVPRQHLLQEEPGKSSASFPAAKTYLWFGVLWSLEKGNCLSNCSLYPWYRDIDTSAYYVGQGSDISLKPLGS